MSIKLRCSSGRAIGKHTRRRTSRLQLSDFGPEGLRVTSAVAGQLNKIFLLGFANPVYNGVSKRSILDKPVIAFVKGIDVS